jgi:hypothetical protein
MRQDAPRSIGEQLSRPDTSGCAGFRTGNCTEMMNALKRWEEKNDPLVRSLKGIFSRRKFQPEITDEEPVADSAPAPKKDKKNKKAKTVYKKKIELMSKEELEALRERQKQVSHIRNERLLQERLESMTLEEIIIFRERSERMKKFRAELKERKNQNP